MKNKRIALNGGSGFIGQAILNRLEQDNAVWVMERNVVTDSLESFEEELAEFEPSIIINLQAYGNHFTQYKDDETFYVNVLHLQRLLSVTKDVSYEAFINFGSSSEYGLKILPMKEDDCLEPMTMYAATKAAGTMLCRGFAKKYDKPIVTVRPFSVYGPGEADHRFIPTVIKSLIKDEQFTLDYQALHDWIYIDDLVDGVLAVIDNVELFKGNAVNIGTGKQYKNEELVSMLSLISGRKPKTEISTILRPNDSKIWVADTRLLKLVGFKAQTTLMEGLKKTYESYKEKYDNN